MTHAAFVLAVLMTVGRLMAAKTLQKSRSKEMFVSSIRLYLL